MLIGRILLDGSPTWVRSEPDGLFAIRDPLHDREALARIEGPIDFLAPVAPHNKIVGLLDNFAGRKDRKGPGIFLKNHSAAIGHRATIRWADGERRPYFEAELAVVIGRTARHVDAARARDFIMGYTIGNDITCFGTVQEDGMSSLSSRFKLFDDSYPLGPFIQTEFDPGRGAIGSFVNDEPKQSADLADMAFGVEEVVAWVSAVMTLHPGDVISMGTPPGLDAMADGDVVRCEIAGLGSLENRVSIA
jgi:2-keto-4-pentenoate hydratase/2-oxohepta-3-ene-1,7-dioic acid hydratase in catechol pathway